MIGRESFLERTVLLNELSSQGSRLPFYVYSNCEDYLYKLFKMQITSLEGRNRLKQEMRNELVQYTYVKTNSRGNSCKGIKITGVLPERESTELRSYQMCRPFPMTVSAAHILCEIIEEDPSIKSLLLVSREFKKCFSYEKKEMMDDSFLGDEILTVLVDCLPKNRFFLLRIEGSFGDVGALAFLKKVPSLLSKTAKKVDFCLHGMKVRNQSVRSLLFEMRERIKLGGL